MKEAVKPASAQSVVAATKTDTASTYDIFNGTKGSALIKITCNQCTAIAMIGNETVPFIFSEQGVGELKYTPVSGLSVYIAICPDGTKPITADILDSNNKALYSYAATSGNWNTTFTIK